MSESKTAQKDNKGLKQPRLETKTTVSTTAVDKTVKDSVKAEVKRYYLVCSKDPSHYKGTPKNFNPKWKCSTCDAPIIEVGNVSRPVNAPPIPPSLPISGSSK